MWAYRRCMPPALLHIHIYTYLATYYAYLSHSVRHALRLNGNKTSWLYTSQWQVAGSQKRGERDVK